MFAMPKNRWNFVAQILHVFLCRFLVTFGRCEVEIVTRKYSSLLVVFLSRS